VTGAGIHLEDGGSKIFQNIGYLNTTLHSVTTQNTPISISAKYSWIQV